MKKRSLCLLFALLVFGSSLVSISFLGTATAANGANWQSGRVIDDGVFINKDDMTASQVQTFLNQKVGTGYYGKVSGQCDTYGTATSEYGGGTRANYGAAHGNPNPFTCLKDYYEVPKTDPAAGIPASNYGGAAIPAGAESAAQIIWDAGQRYSINPKVLLVMIQKESAGPLTTDDWPFRSQYTYAMGAHCPDGPNGAQCDSNYAGFSIQIFESARLLRYYLDNMQQSWWTYTKPYQVNSVMWNTQYSTYTDGSGNTVPCGAGNVSVIDKATAALYAYTPYQPNQAALNNLYGSVPAGSGFDSKCAAYGNRNFWRIFQDWFGNIYADPYNAAYYSESAYPHLNPGQPAAVSLEYQNLGSQSWYDDTSLSGAPSGTSPVHLATSHVLNRASAFSGTWPTANRAATTFSAVYESDGTTLAGNQDVVVPGQIAKFTFSVTTPATLSPGTYTEYFQPVAEGSTSQFFNDSGTYTKVTVNPVQSLSWSSQSAYPTVAPTDTSTTTAVLFKNSGNVPAYDDTSLSSAPQGSQPTHLAISCPINSSSDFKSSNWASSSRPSVNFSAVYESDGLTLSSNQHVAMPGQIIKFSFGIHTPAQYASNIYKLCVQPVIEGSSTGAYPDMGVFFNVTVPSVPVISYTQLPSAISLVSGEKKTLSYQITNNGNAPLGSGATISINNASSYQDSSWISNTTVQTIPASLPVGSSQAISLPLFAPVAQNGQSDILALGVNDSTNGPVNDGLASIVTHVSQPNYATSFSSESSFPTLTYGQTTSVFFSYKNLGNKPWYDDTSAATTTSTRSPQATHLATAGPINRGSGFASGWTSSDRPDVNFSAVYESDGITLAADQHTTQPGQIAKFAFAVSPASWVNPGDYREYFQPIIEGTPDGIMSQTGTYINVNLLAPSYQASFYSQSAYPTLSAGQNTNAYISYKNTGNETWFDDASFANAPANSKQFPVHLATTSPINRTSIFGSSWASNSRPALTFSAVYESDGTTLATNQHAVAPGQIGKYNFTVSVPLGTAKGTYAEYFQPIAEGSLSGLFGNPGTFLNLTVN